MTFTIPARANMPDVQGEAQEDVERPPVANKPNVKGEAAGSGEVKPGAA